MNKIESEWLQLKRQELVVRIFDHEYDLAMAVIDGVEIRAEKGEYQSHRFLFNSA